jgi:hypothetical protein
MKKLLATIALLCLSSTVLAHDIYSNLRDRAGHPCCTGQDCKPGRLRCCRMVVTIYQGVMKLFPLTWQHHHLMIASTIVSIIQRHMISGVVDQHGKANPRLDVSLLQ